MPEPAPDPNDAGVATGVVNPQAGEAPAPTDDFTAFGEVPADLKPVIAGKGWKTPADAVGSYAALEKLHGLGPDRLLALPANAEDKEGWGKVYDRLGRPKDATGYDLKVEGLDEVAGKEFAAKAHEVGLTPAQAKALAEWDVTRGGTAIQAAHDAFVLKGQADVTALKGEWGQAYAAKEAQARAAAQQFGINTGVLTGEELTAMEKALGTAKMLKFFAAVGEGLGEATVIEGDSTPSGFGPMTPATAASKIAEKMSDSNFMTAYLGTNMDPKDPRHIEAVKVMSDLHAAKNPAT